MKKERKHNFGLQSNNHLSKSKEKTLTIMSDAYSSSRISAVSVSIK